MQRIISEHDVREYLDQKMVAHADLGYRYLLLAIMLLAKGKVPRETFMVKNLYGKVANECAVSETQVERNIRLSIAKAAVRSGYVGCHITNKEFIACAYDELLDRVSANEYCCV